MYNVGKGFLCHVRTAKVQIRTRIRAIWSEHFLAYTTVSIDSVCGQRLYALSSNFIRAHFCIVESVTPENIESFCNQIRFINSLSNRTAYTVFFFLNIITETNMYGFEINNSDVSINYFIENNTLSCCCESCIDCLQVRNPNQHPEIPTPRLIGQSRFPGKRSDSPMWQIVWTHLVQTLHYISHNLRKRTFWHVRPTKTIHVSDGTQEISQSRSTTFPTQ